VMAEASTFVAANGIAHAAIDADTLGIVHLQARRRTDIMYRNLETVGATRGSGRVTRLLLAEAVEHRGEIERIRRVSTGCGDHGLPTGGRHRTCGNG